MTMITRLIIGFGRRRQLHTIVSTEIIKPSSPTPSHLKTHNLSLLDQTAINAFMPMVAFYPKTNNYGSSRDKVLDLKNSLSQTLTKYYPFAGRHAKIAPSYVDCNDDGAEFLEASIGGRLSDFFQNYRHEDLDQFFPHGRTWYNENRRRQDLQSDGVIPLAVQLSHFECGGVAVAISLSHKIADGSSLVHFFHDWAKMTRFLYSSSDQKQEFPIDPWFISSPQNINKKLMEMSFDVSNDFITRSFTFSNSKINDLKNKVISMTAECRQPITNPTRVEVLNWILYKCSVAAATKNNSGSFRPSGVAHVIDLRNKMMEPLPKNTIGNLFYIAEIATMNESEMKPESFIGELKKQKMQVQGITNVQEVFSHLPDMSSETVVQEMQRKFEEAYLCTSLCRFPAYEINFGWGNPIKTAIGGNLQKKCFGLMDAPNVDGIEALVCLSKQDMEIIQTDPELLELC